VSDIKTQDVRGMALSTFQNATQCGDHRDDSISEAELGDVLYYGDNNADEFESAAVFRAGDEFVVAVESSDYTGHGCQCSGSATKFKLLDDALRLGLSESEAELCGATADRTEAIARFQDESEEE
jgi:hypothetical protein